MTDLPLATIVIPAYQHGQFVGRAIDSALTQDWPSERLEVIVIDDGSTDETPEVLASYRERIRVIRTANRGVVAAVSLGFEQACGEVIALLAADDESPPERLRLQWEVLARRPEVGLVYGDMELIGPAGELLHPSFAQAVSLSPLEGPGILGRLLSANCVSGGPSLMRASLRDAILPMPPEAVYEDWWMALKIAECSQIAYLPRPIYRYRHHGANMNLGAPPEQVLNLRLRELPFRRALLRDGIVDLSQVSTAELSAAVQKLDSLAQNVAEMIGRWVHQLLPVSAADRNAATAAFARGHLAAALGHDPAHPEARAALGIKQPVAPALDSRSRVTVALVAEVLQQPQLLERYLAAVGADDDATLVLYAPGAELTQMHAQLVASAPSLADDGSADVLVYAVPGGVSVERMLLDRASDALTDSAQTPSNLPRFTPCPA